MFTRITLNASNDSDKYISIAQFIAHNLRDCSNVPYVLLENSRFPSTQKPAAYGSTIPPIQHVVIRTCHELSLKNHSMGIVFE